MFLKRTIFIGGSIILVGALYFGNEVLSYFRTTAGYVKESVKDAVPVQFQMDHARQIIKDLEPTIQKHRRAIAKEEVQLARLAERIQNLQKQTKKEKTQMLTLRSDLHSDQKIFRYASLTYTRDQVKNDLTKKFKRYKTRQSTLEHLKKTDVIRQKGLQAAREKLDGLFAMRDQLLLEIENLEMQKQMIDAAKVSNRNVFDDSKLGRVKELIDDLQVRLATESKLADVSEPFHTEIPVDAPDEQDIVDQVTDYFGLGEPEAETVAAATE